MELWQNKKIYATQLQTASLFLSNGVAYAAKIIAISAMPLTEDLLVQARGHTLRGNNIPRRGILQLQNKKRTVF
jgi:hypothetical protein